MQDSRGTKEAQGNPVALLLRRYALRRGMSQVTIARRIGRSREAVNQLMSVNANRRVNLGLRAHKAGEEPLLPLVARLLGVPDDEVGSAIAAALRSRYEDPLEVDLTAEEQALAARAAAARRAAGISRAEAAEMLSRALKRPVSGTVLAQWEDGSAQIPSAYLPYIAEVYRKPLLYFFPRSSAASNEVRKHERARGVGTPRGA